MQASVPAERSRLLGSLYADLLPAVDAWLFTLDQLHADDPPAEHADIVRFGRQRASTPDRLERLADAALYLAKRQGRNRVELADPSPAPAVPAPAVSTANGAAPLTEAAHGP